MKRLLRWLVEGAAVLVTLFVIAYLVLMAVAPG